MKTRALEAIGETGLEPLAQIDAALAANERVKYSLSLLQTALAHADHPEDGAPTLELERVACGVEDAALDDVVAQSRREGERYRIPHAHDVIERIAADMRVMAAPVLASESRRDDFAARLERNLGALPQPEDDLVAAAAVGELTRLGGKTDSLHQLVMDLHHELNGLQAEFAEETLDGASVYRLDPADRPLVAAFMAGVNRTAPLKFGHPGLGTTATRTGGRLVIQNDIGETQAHVLVVHVDGLTITLTYADVHPERLAFFQQMLSRFAVSWTSQAAGEHAARTAGEAFTLATGSFRAADEAECRTYLEWLGSRIVFLIDWNRARKGLRPFLRGSQRLAVLIWAAREEIGHRGFLELGGGRIIDQAIEETAGSAMHFGDRLCDVIGDDAATAFVEFVLRTATSGLSTNQSRALIRDRIFAELRGHFTSEGRRLLRVAADHAALIFEVAVLVRECVLAQYGGDEDVAAFAQRGRSLEHDADQLVIEVREAVRRRPEHAVFRRLLEVADDAADELEDGVFLLGLLEPGGESDVLDKLHALADIVVSAAQEWVKATADATAVESDGPEDFLVGIDRIAVLEHQSDDVERDLTRAAFQHTADFRRLHLITTIGDALESATDALKNASLILRGHVLGTDPLA